MSKLTAEQKAKGRKRFLDSDSHLNIKQKIEGITQSQADAQGIPLERLLELETMKALSEVAYSINRNSTELFLSYIADTTEEFVQMCEAHGLP